MASSVGRRCGLTGERRQRFLRKGRRLSTKPKKEHSTCCLPIKVTSQENEGRPDCLQDARRGMDHIHPEKRIKGRRPLGLYMINNIN